MSCRDICKISFNATIVCPSWPDDELGHRWQTLSELRIPAVRVQLCCRHSTGMQHAPQLVRGSRAEDCGRVDVSACTWTPASCSLAGSSWVEHSAIEAHVVASKWPMSASSTSMVWPYSSGHQSIDYHAPDKQSAHAMWQACASSIPCCGCADMGQGPCCCTA